MCEFKNNGEHNRIDKCMNTRLNLINSIIDKRKAEVVASCCGHKKYPMTIIIKMKAYGNLKALAHPETFYFGFNKKTILYYDLISGKYIPRKRNFYKKDKQGYYFIPEVSKEIIKSKFRKIKYW